MAEAMTKAERRAMQRMAETVAALAEKENERTIIANETPREREARETVVERTKSIISNLEELGGKMFDDDDIVYEGNRLVIPETMSLRQARQFLEAKEEEMERETNFSRSFNYRPWDGAWCLWQVMKRLFGAVGHRGSIRFTMFGPVEDPPQMISIPIDVGKTDQVPWGRFSLPFLPDTWFESDVQAHPEYGALFTLRATGPKKHRYAIEGVFNALEDELASNSLYRGKAFDGQGQPEFIDVFSIDRSKVVYSAEVLHQLEANVWAQLRYTDAVSNLGVPLKRAVLVHGSYGTGKTLAMMLTGQEAIQAGWTFIKARPGRDDLTTVLQTAKLYQPCVVAYEDLDKIASSDDDASITRLLDDFDGIEAKNTRILCVLTTNRPEKIHKAMARPGRLDAMIEIEDLDMAGVASLVKVRIPEGTLDTTIDWEAVYKDAEGYKPAFVTEFADRALRYVLVRCEGELNGQVITTEDLCLAARGLRPQYDKMQGAKDTAEPETLGQALDRRVQDVLEETLVPGLLAKNQ